jgi:hypothetical protein
MNKFKAYLTGSIVLSGLTLLAGQLHTIVREAIGRPFTDDTPPYYAIGVVIMMIMYSMIILPTAVFIYKRMQNKTPQVFSRTYALVLSSLLFMLPLWGVILDSGDFQIDSLFWVDAIGFFVYFFAPIFISTKVTLHLAYKN